MKRNSKKNGLNIRQILYTILGILCVCSLFFLAVLFPNYYCHFYDSNTLHQITVTENKISTYETSYDSFEEKLHAIARAYSKNSTLRAVPMSDLEITPDQSELTAIANEELKKMKENNIIREKITLKEKKLTTAERYTIYSKDDLPGFSCWLLVYKMKKRTFTLYIDEEFHTIYFFNIQKTDLPNTKNNISIDSSLSYSSADDQHKIRQKMFYAWWQGMIQYYNLDVNHLSLMTENTKLYGEIQFEDSFQIMLFEQWSYDEYGNENWSMGIPMEKMIQF